MRCSKPKYMYTVCADSGNDHGSILLGTEIRLPPPQSQMCGPLRSFLSNSAVAWRARGDSSKNSRCSNRRRLLVRNPRRIHPRNLRSSNRRLHWARPQSVDFYPSTKSSTIPGCQSLRGLGQSGYCCRATIVL